MEIDGGHITLGVLVFGSALSWVEARTGLGTKILHLGSQITELHSTVKGMEAALSNGGMPRCKQEQLMRQMLEKRVDNLEEHK